MDFPGLMILFARVVEAGSFSAASRELDQSPSAVSKQMAQLENRVGVRLLARSRSGVSLTEDGEAFYVRCAEVRRQVEAAQAMVMSFGDAPKGRLRVAVTTAFGKTQVLPALPLFLERFPHVGIDIELSDRPVDFSAARIDLAIQFTEQIEDLSLVTRKLVHTRRVMVAAPQYLTERGVPARIEDLESHECLQLFAPSRLNQWSFDGYDGRKLLLKSRFQGNSADTLYRAALAGLGVARLSTYLVNEDLRSGRLVRVLPEFEDNGSDIQIIYSARRNLAPKVRAFIDHLLARFTPVPPWEREAR